MRQVKGVQGSHKASIRDVEMVQETVKGTVWGKVIDRKVKKRHQNANNFTSNPSFWQ